MDSVCPNCGTANRSSSLFCASCGQALLAASGGEVEEKDAPGLDLPWLRSVQEQAEKPPTEKLTDPQPPLSEKTVSETAPVQDSPDGGDGTPGPAEIPGQPAVPVEPQGIDDSAPSTAQADVTGDAPQGPPDEPPPGWVVSILEPAAPQPGPGEQTYEPEELSHIMPWVHGDPNSEESLAGEDTIDLPPWLTNVTVQETLDAGGVPSTAPQAELDGLELEGIEPFAPPTGFEEPAAAQVEEKPRPPEQVPEWLRSISTGQAAGASTAADSGLYAAPETTELNSGVFGPTIPGLPSEALPPRRDIPVRAPRAGAVETITALLQPSADTRRVVTGALPVQAALPAESARSPLLRWLLPDGLIYLLVLASLLFILAARLPFGELTPPASADVQEFYSRIEALPQDRPALVVFDWDATRSGEMQPLAEAVIHHLMSRRVRFVTMSTNPQGPGFAQLVTGAVAADSGANYGYQYGRDYRVLGYLPGSEAALAAILNNFEGTLPRDYLNNQRVDGTSLVQGSSVRGIEDFGLVIALSSDEGELRGWIEQVASRTGVPMLAAVPQALVPLVRPYKDIPRAGLQATIGGPLDTYQYSSQLQGAGRASGSSLSDASMPDRLNAQSVASLLLGLVILAALVRLATTRTLRR